MSNNEYADERPSLSLAWYRLGILAADLVELVNWRRVVDGKLERHDSKLENLEDAVKELASAMKGVQKTLVALLLTIAGSAVTIALSVLIATGKI